MTFSVQRAMQLLASGFWDSEQDDPALRNHFASADGLSADSHASPESRKRIRERMRFEFANNSYVQGIVRTHVNNVIGTGPRLQVNSNAAGTSDAIADEIQRAMTSWMMAAKLVDRLRLMFQAELVDGEGLAIISTDERLRHPVKLAWKLVECDQLTSPIDKITGDMDRHVDGIDLDEFGNPVRYHFLKRHPGSMNAFAAMLEHAPPVPAESVIHLFHRDRPGQHRGVSRCQAMLMPAAAMRQYTMATLKAARRAASLSAVVKSNNSAEIETSMTAPYDEVELPDDSAMTLPAGWDIYQFKAEQPVGTYPEFNREMIRMAGRVVNMPLNKAAADSSGYNYSSGRLDHQDYGMFCRVEREHLVCDALEVTLREFAKEAVLRDGGDLLSDEARMLLDEWINRPEGFPPHSWNWDEPEHADPLKEAQAEAIRLQNRTVTYADSCSRRNRDWRRHFEQVAIEQEKMNELGITAGQAASAFGEQGQEEDERQADERSTAGV